MVKKKRSDKKKTVDYNNNPFKKLKGFAVSASDEKVTDFPAKSETISVEKERTFAEEMDFLGVDPLNNQGTVIQKTLSEQSAEFNASLSEQTEEAVFLDALGTLDVRFNDQIPKVTKPSAPRRLKQLKQGRLTPDASIDLHGLQRHQVAEKIENFLQNARHHQWHTVLIVTGRGLHSADGEPVLREEVEKYLSTEGRALVTEWGRAPRQYGGEGALVAFLKKTTME